MNTKHPQLTAETRQNLMTAFWQLYQTTPLSKITVGQITAIAGYNRGTFYHYFSDIYHVLETIEEDLLATIRKNIFEQVLHAPETILQQIEPLAKLYTQEGAYLAKLLGENGDPTFLHKFIQVLHDCLATNLSQRDTLSPQQELTITFAGTAIIYSFMYWYQHQDQLTPEEAIKTIQYLLKEGCYAALTPPFPSSQQ